MYDSLKPVVLTGNLQGSFLASYVASPVSFALHALTHLAPTGSSSDGESPPVPESRRTRSTRSVVA